MEPTRTAYIIKAVVDDIRQQYIKRWLGDVGPDARFKDEPAGWFVFLDGSHEGLYLGDEKPNLNPGDKVTITIQKEPHALPLPTPK